jgi:hypothetical protein
MESASNKFAAYGVYQRGVHLQDVVAALNQAGIRNDQICLLLAPGHPIAADVRDMRCTGRMPASDNALESLMSWLTRLGAVVISNLAFFVRSPEFVHALVEQEVSRLGGHRGALANLGIPAAEAGRLGTRISNGGGLIYVNCSQSARSEPAMEIFRQTGAEEACAVH